MKKQTHSVSDMEPAWITWSPGGAKMLWIRSVGHITRAAHAWKYTPFNQGQRLTPLIITLLSLPAGIEKGTLQLRWCVENKKHLNRDGELDPFDKRENLIWDSFCPVFHHLLWKVNISVKFTSKGAFEAYHQPWLIVGMLLHRYIHKKKNLTTEHFGPNGKWVTMATSSYFFTHMGVDGQTNKLVCSLVFGKHQGIVSVGLSGRIQSMRGRCLMTCLWLLPDCLTSCLTMY